MVGAGPAGISAAIQLKKEGLPFTLFERGRPGGLLRYAWRVDNLPGHRGKTGRELCSLFNEHLDSMGITVEGISVVSIERETDHFLVNGSEYSAVILATGSHPRRVDIPGALYFIEDEKELKGKRLLLLGAGDLAYDNALRALKAGAEVTLVRRGEPGANLSLLREARAAGIVETLGVPTDVLVDGRNFLLGDRRFDILAVFIGRTPSRDLIAHMGPLEVNLPSFSTSVNGLYVVGDAALGTLSQTALSSGSGLAAAMHISRMVRGR